MHNAAGFIKEVQYAYDNVSHYKRKLDGLGIDPKSITSKVDIERLPYTEKVDYRKNFPMGVLAKGFALNHPMLVKTQSSGTTGERLTTVEIGMLLLQRAMCCTGINKGISVAFNKKDRKICRYAAPNCSDVECANPNSVMEDRLLPDGTLVLPVYHDLMTTSPKMIDQAIEEILRYQPDLFYVDPTHFCFLLRHFKRKGVTPPVIPVVTSYSAATRVSKRQIMAYYSQQDHFAELVSSSEMGWFAMNCPHGNLHLNDDSFFFEFSQPDGQAAKAGEMAELCISSIDQGALPHMRYRTGDMVRYSETPCACGSKNRTMVMEGRLTHFITKDGQPHLSAQGVDALIGAPDWLDVYQLEQMTATDFALKMIVNDDYSTGLEAPLMAAFEEAMGMDIKVMTSVVDYIATERSGKFQAVKGGVNQ
jgi:phenylacetate-CoA ligase